MSSTTEGQKHGDDLLVVASKGGSDERLGDKFTARARTANPEEKPEMWRTRTAAWPAYDDNQNKADREIPVVVLERV